MIDLKPLGNPMLTSMVRGIIRYLSVTSLRNALQREPTTFEVICYEYELWFRELSRRLEEITKIYQKIHDLACSLDESRETLWH